MIVKPTYFSILSNRHLYCRWPVASRRTGDINFPPYYILATATVPWKWILRGDFLWPAIYPWWWPDISQSFWGFLRVFCSLKLLLGWSCIEDRFFTRIKYYWWWPHFCICILVHCGGGGGAILTRLLTACCLLLWYTLNRPSTVFFSGRGEIWKK